MGEHPRWAWERAVRDSDLSAAARLVALTVATFTGPDGVTPAPWSPSLSALASSTGLNRSTVQRQLNQLEALGWLTRARPAPGRATTRYQLTRRTVHLVEGVDIPVETEQPGAPGTQPAHRLGAPDDRSRRTVHPLSEREQVPARARAREATPEAALATAVYDALPDHLAAISRRTLEQVCAELVHHGWTPDVLWNAVSTQSWVNALGPGAVIGWLRHHGSKPPKLSSPPPGRRTCTAPDCHQGWLGEDEAGRPRPCPTCRPAAARQQQPPAAKAAAAGSAGELLFIDQTGG